MNRILRWAQTRFQAIVSMMVAHKLDPRALEEAIRGKLPPGTLKSGVIEFVRAMRPFRCEDYGKKVTAHWIEETGDLVRSWNILVVFHFDEEDRLLHYSQTATDFIDYDLVAMSLQ